MNLWHVYQHLGRSNIITRLIAETNLNFNSRQKETLNNKYACSPSTASPMCEPSVRERLVWDRLLE